MRKIWASFVAACFVFLTVADAQVPTFTDLTVSSSSCDANGEVLLDIDVSATGIELGSDIEVYAGIEATNLEFFAYTSTPTRVRLPHPGSGSAFVRAYFVADGTGTEGIFTNVPIPTCSQACAITDLTLLGFEPCDAFARSEAIFEVSIQNAPANILEIGGLRSTAQTNLPASTGSFIMRLPVLANGQILDVLAHFPGHDECYLFKNFQTPVPDCPGTCALSNFTIRSTGSCNLAGMREVVTELDVQPPWPGALLRVGENLHPAIPGTMVFTNIVDASATAPFTAAFPNWWENDFVLPTGVSLLIPALNECNEISLQLPANFPCSCSLISGVQITPGSCNGSPDFPLTVTVNYTNVPANGFLDIEGQSFPLSGSPQTETVWLPVADQTSTRVQVGIASGTPTAIICSQEETVTLPGCSVLAPGLANLEVVSMSPCQPGGFVTVNLRVDATNTSPLETIEFSGIHSGPYQLRTLVAAGSNTITTSFNVPVGGTWQMRAVLFRTDSMGGDTILEQLPSIAVIPDCDFAPCASHIQVTSTAGPCLSAGQVDLTFAITALNAAGKMLRVSLPASSDPADGYVQTTIQYTNSPSFVTLRVEADGASRTGSVAEVDSQMNPSCETPFHVSLPNCFLQPSTPPFIHDIDSPATTRGLDFTSPPGFGYVVEQAVTLEGPWTPLTQSTSNTAALQTFQDTSGISELMFFRIRILPTPIIP